MWVGVGPILESGARARAKFFIFYFFWHGTHHTIPPKKKVTRAIPAARADPKSKTILFFFARSWCMPWGYALLSPAQPSQELSSGSGELSAEG